jgi:cation diffusion facilitator family transporter
MQSEIPYSNRSRVALLSIASNAALIMLKLAAAFLTGSVSILSEALHSGLDLAAAVMAFFSVRAADKPADPDHPFGHGKFEPISAAAEGLLILAAAGLIIHAAVGRIISGKAEISLPIAGMGVMGISVIVNIWVAGRLMKIAKLTNSLALEADAWHLRTDVYTSFGVFAGMLVLLIGEKLGWKEIGHLDPLLAIGIALLILKASWDIIRRSYDQLTDQAMPEEDHRRLVVLLEAHYSKELIDFHSLRTRRAGNQSHIDFHLLVPAEMPLEEAHALCDHLENDIQELIPRSEVLIHVEPASDKDHSEVKSV